MPDIEFIQPDGTAMGFEAPDGVSVMQAATGYGVPGIVGECGGQLACATCHVVVDAAWASQLPPPRAEEQALLDATAVKRQAHSRLSCQIALSPALQGLVLHVPQTQY